MKVYRDVQVQGDTAAIAEARKRVSAYSPTSAWERDDQIVKRVSGTDATAFRYRGGQAPEAFVWLMWEPAAASVSNIVPEKAGSLTYDQYNSIAKWFVDAVLTPTFAGILSLRVALGAEEEDIDDLLSAETAKALRAFSHTANKATGASHPNDAERWHDFVIRAHLEDAPLDPEMLHRWLCEDEHWSDEQGNSLAIQYEQARELLRQYDEQRTP